ncbi:hypothetical protein [Candidatus Albibeggiatoa sp. nov. NOAA]|uniref:hypothetical protein n=1 Tax=Candidatus Albibeggiatoa sp. nov. NOAA TaxID=3162724 RepID=UPI0032F92804|nr:hypothetical protein [Thiotrichaceae bacterium]
MKRHLLAKGLVILGISISASAISAMTDDYPNYQPMPSGYGYMEENEALEKAIKNKDHAKGHAVVREHGWKLWAGIMQPAESVGWPLWYTWPNTVTAFKPESSNKCQTNQSANELGASNQASSTDDSKSRPSLINKNQLNSPADRVKHTDIPHANFDDDFIPYYPIPEPVKKKYWEVITYDSNGDPNISSVEEDDCKKDNFLFNGDIMIPTESLNMELTEWIRDPEQPLYKRVTLSQMYKDGQKNLDTPEKAIVTKHMYWPVKKEGLTAIPVWREDYLGEPLSAKNENYPFYAGYEMWKTLAAIDPSGEKVGNKEKVSYLYGVSYKEQPENFAPVTAEAEVFGLESFYYHQVTQEEWNNFSKADQAILSASSYWANGKPFEPGDYLVTIAMHINTKEVPTWSLTSVWWSDRPNEGQYAKNRPVLPNAKGAWDHYLLVDSHGIPQKGISGRDTKEKLPVAMNPYIEPVVHPIVTNCNNCHIRAGWPTGGQLTERKASYQNPDCPSLLDKLSTDDACLDGFILTDFQWFIPGHAIASKEGEFCLLDDDCEEGTTCQLKEGLTAYGACK